MADFDFNPNMPGPFLDYDFALIFLPEPITDIAPVAMNKEEDIPANPGEDMEAIGWGDTNPDPDVVDLPDIPKTVILQYLLNDQCATVYGDSITPNTICGYDDGKATCQGDSGMLLS